MTTVFWGDIHRQTAWTCGEGSVDDHFRTAREHFGMDFAAVTDNARLEDPRERLFPGEKLRGHRHFLPGLEAHSITAENWQEVKDAVHRHTIPGEFVAFLGYEWCSARYGDHNVYYDIDNGPLFLPDRLESLYAGNEQIDSDSRLLIPHHPGYARGRRGTDWNVHDPRQERLVEIYSTQHGCSEGLASDPRPLFSRSMGGLAPGSSVQDALLRGYKVGFTGGSDSHALLQKSGLVGVYADTLDRTSLFRGLWERRTIATTGPKFPAIFHINGFGPGSIVSLDTLPTITIDLPEQEWLEVQLVRNGSVVHTWQSSENRQLRYSETPSDLQPDNYYYVRILLPNDELVWISPIWVSYLPETAFAQDILYWLPEGDVYLWGRFVDAETLVVKVHNHRRSDQSIELVAWRLCDEQENTLVEEYPVGGLLVAPDETEEMVFRLAKDSGTCKAVIQYRDASDNLRTVVRSRFLTPNEESSFVLES